MIRVLIAPDKFKGSLTTFEVCDAVEQGLLQASSSFSILKSPLADGGDGMAEVIRYYTGAAKHKAFVQDPLGRIIEAEWLLAADGKTAVIEMAKASGLALLNPEEYNPLLTSSYGTGQLIKAALEKGVEKIILGIGGSATNDGGIGMAAALGYCFFDGDGQEVKPVGGNLENIESIDSSGKMNLDDIRIEVACDVKNLLLGKEGAACIYAPQKGADRVMVELLEKGMAHFSSVVKRDVGLDLTTLEGGGAAGGMGAGSMAFLQAEIRSGIDVVMGFAGIEKHLPHMDFVMTGEGKIDAQTLRGKVVMGIATLAKKYGKPVIAFCGSQTISAPEITACGIDAVFPVMKYPMEWQEAKENAYAFLKDSAFTVGNLLQRCSGFGIE